MPTHFIHLENALKRANEFLEVQNKRRALDILCDVLHSKKHRLWQKDHEEIMLKYLELCVDLKQSYLAKEGLFQYKIICQQTYINSFEEVIRKYIQMAEKRTNEAKEQSQANISEIDDLENAQTPEDILMSAVSVEGSQDRKDRVVLIPWVKFLWESYRQCLEMLKNNSKTERLYHDIAHQAFMFCIKYNRKTEFRKLCDYLHIHLDQLKKQQVSSLQPQNAINLNSAESQAMQLETRLRQLDIAIQLELWQEAYKAADDIRKFNLMNLTKKGLGKPQLIASYYQKLALVFWKANSNLFHATALFLLFSLSKDLKKNITSEDIQKMASRLVLATLSIPIPPIRPEIDKLVDTEENIIDQHHRNLSSLLGISHKPPTRASMIKDLKRMGVLGFASQPIQDLFQLLEIEFNPLGICSRVQQIIEYIEKSTSDPQKPTEAPEMLQYIPALKEVTVIRLIREIGQVYRTIEFSRLSELCPFVDPVHLEKLVVESARRHDLQVRIDHRRGCFVFGTELRVSTGEEFIEGPHLQSMPNEQMRRQLVSMYSSLQKAIHLIEPDVIKRQRETLKRQIMKSYFMYASEDHRLILNRQSIIEKRREKMEQMGIRREMDERRRAEEEEARRKEAESQRLLEETRERERAKREKEKLELHKQITLEHLKQMKEALPEFELDQFDENELANLRPQDLQQRRIEQLEKERKEQFAKQRKYERKVDHFERAKRLEEIPLLKQEYEEWRVKDQELWAEYQDMRIVALKEEREMALKERERLLRVLDDKKEFETRVLTDRQEEYQENLRKFDAIVESERKKRLEVRRQKRSEELRVIWLKEKEAERLNRQAEKQRLRIAQIEEKLRQNLAANDVPPPPKPDEPIMNRRPEKNVSDDQPPPRPFQPKRQPVSLADATDNWREAPPPPPRQNDEPFEKQPRDGRSAYGGRYSEGRPRPDSRDAFDSRQPRAPYGGRESDSSIRRGGNRRDYGGGFSRHKFPPGIDNNWREPRKQEAEGEDDDGGWMKVDHGRKGGSGRPPPDHPYREDSRQRYGGRDSRERGPSKPPPPPPSHH